VRVSSLHTFYLRRNKGCP